VEEFGVVFFLYHFFGFLGQFTHELVVLVRPEGVLCGSCCRFALFVRYYRRTLPPPPTVISTRWPWQVSRVFFVCAVLSAPFGVSCGGCVLVFFGVCLGVWGVFFFWSVQFLPKCGIPTDLCEILLVFAVRLGTASFLGSFFLFCLCGVGRFWGGVLGILRYLRVFGLGVVGSIPGWLPC